MFLEFFEQIYALFQTFFINIPVDNTLGLFYVILNTIAVLFLGFGAGEIDLPF